MRKNSKYNPKQDLFLIFSGLAVAVYFFCVQLFLENQHLFWWTVAIILIFFFISIWILFIRKHKNYLRIRSLEQMKNMDWREFEKFIAFILKKNGFKARERSGTNDGGIDIDASKLGQKYVIQCKKWKNYTVGVEVVRAFVGAMRAEGNDVQGIFITTSKLTKPAMEYIEKIAELELWDENNLEAYILEYTQSKDIIEKRNPLCEVCGAEMVVRKSYRGENKGSKFYGCSNYPSCKHTIDIS